MREAFLANESVLVSWAFSLSNHDINDLIEPAFASREVFRGAYMISSSTGNVLVKKSKKRTSSRWLCRGLAGYGYWQFCCR